MFAVWVKSDATLQLQPRSVAALCDKPALQKHNGDGLQNLRRSACHCTWGSGERFQGFARDFRGGFPPPETRGYNDFYR
jgi:hypothetical protein